MNNNTNEAALEAAIQQALTGITSETINGAQEPSTQHLK